MFTCGIIYRNGYKIRIFYKWDGYVLIAHNSRKHSSNEQGQLIKNSLKYKLLKYLSFGFDKKILEAQKKNENDTFFQMKRKTLMLC